MKPLLVVDIDDTSVHFTPAFLNFYNEKHKTNFVSEKCINFKLENILGISTENFKQELDNFYDSPFFNSMLPIIDAPSVLENLRKYYNVLFLTYRDLRLKEKTSNLFLKLFGRYPIVYSRELNKKKYEICKSLGASLIIEDYYPNAIECSNHGIECFLFNQPWNYNFPLEDTLIERVYSWEDIENRLIK